MDTRMALAGLFSLTLGVAAQASSFSESFDAENGGLGAASYAGFGAFNVQSGAVDLIANGDGGLHCAGSSGSCVELEGGGGLGQIITKDSFAIAAGDDVFLSFDLSGNQRNGSVDGFFAAFVFTPALTGADYTPAGPWAGGSLPGFTTTQVATSTFVNGLADFTSYSVTFHALTAANVRLRFGSALTGDGVGVIIDNIRFGAAPSAAPEPAGWAVMLTGFGLMGGVLGRRASAARA